MNVSCPHCGGRPPIVDELEQLLMLGVKTEILRISNEHPDNRYLPDLDAATMHFSKGTAEYKIMLTRID